MRHRRAGIHTGRRGLDGRERVRQAGRQEVMGREGDGREGEEWRPNTLDKVVAGHLKSGME